jgi:alpha-1,3-mannosyltransferase
LSLLTYFVIKKWSFLLYRTTDESNKEKGKDSTSLKSIYIVTTLFTCNFIGIFCARSLHYQFYTWYFHQLPFLIWIIRDVIPIPIGIFILLGIEIVWNIYPSSFWSSLTLQILHIVLMWGVIASSNTAVPIVKAKKKKN